MIRMHSESYYCDCAPNRVWRASSQSMQLKKFEKIISRNRAAQELRDAFRQDMAIYRRQEEVGYALILEATYSCP
jgi:hypothetical protein